MAKYKVKLGIHHNEVSEQFMSQMASHMEMGYFRFGPVRHSSRNAVKCLGSSISRYLSTGNKEFLVDAANYAMIEYIKPSIPNTHYTADDRHGVESNIKFFRDQNRGG